MSTPTDVAIQATPPKGKPSPFRIEHAHEREVALCAAKHKASVLVHMHGYNAQESFVKEVMKSKKKGSDALTALKHTDKSLRANASFMHWCIDMYGQPTFKGKGICPRKILKLAGPALLRDSTFVLQVMRDIDTPKFKHLFAGLVHESLLEDKKFVCYCAHSDVDVMRYASYALRSDRDFIHSVIIAIRDSFPNGARKVLFSASHTLRWDAGLHDLLAHDVKRDYVKSLHHRWARVRKRWYKAIVVVMFVRRLQRSVEAGDIEAREADLTNAMEIGGVGESEKYMGLLRMAWDMGRYASRSKRPRHA